MTTQHNGQPLLPNGIRIRPFVTADLPGIQALCRAEGWPTATDAPGKALVAFEASTLSLVAVKADRVIGYIRALSDTAVTTYICELLVDRAHRGGGVGRALIAACHRAYPSARIDLLAMEASSAFYRADGFREFIGFRKSYS